MPDPIPQNRTIGSWADQLFDEAVARGEIDLSASAGRKLDLSDGDDPDWWLKRKLKDEEFVALPPALQLRRDRDDLLAALDDLRRCDQVRDALERLNARIRYANSHAIAGPPSTLMPVDVEGLVAGWAQRHPDRLGPRPVAAAPDGPTRRRWWPWPRRRSR